MQVYLNLVTSADDYRQIAKTGKLTKTVNNMQITYIKKITHNCHII